MNLREAIYDALVNLTHFYSSEKVSPEKIKAYTNFLISELTIEELRFALRQIVKKSKFFPSIAEIIEVAKGGDEDNAILIANEILSLAASMGQYQNKEAKEILKDKWEIVQKFGGWTSLCLIQNEEIPFVRSQLKALVKAQKKRSEFDLAIQNQNKELLQEKIKVLQDHALINSKKIV